MLLFDHMSAKQAIFNLSTALAESKSQYREVMREIAQNCPWEDDGYGRQYCFFCVKEHVVEPHEEVCLWMRAVTFCKANDLDYYKES